MAPVILNGAGGQIVDSLQSPMVLRLSYALAFVSSAGLMLVAAMPVPSLTAHLRAVFANMAASHLRAPLSRRCCRMAPPPILNRAIARMSRRGTSPC